MRTFLCAILIAVWFPGHVSAQARAGVVICQKDSTGALTMRTRRCVGGETKISNISALRGADGADGSLRIYGDGSDGALSVSAVTSWTTQGLKQYTTCTIASGATLTVPSGTVLRCSESFANEGTIVVASPYNAPSMGGIAASGGMLPAIRGASVPGLGWGRSAGGSAAFGTDAAAVAGGSAGFNLNPGYAATILRPGPIGGGAGGGANRRSWTPWRGHVDYTLRRRRDE